ncbi:LysR family transcriptional regulator [Amycolatopsis pithecellobii]|uniref:LysR family transcriptional regulator n=1 Tax=Amycolatopsis pithecellobii TaxID=664692 RepID=A0A6N7ZB99_9PSEU|nr:LysR family transcriptional regulator [Amycolatopsis pithecellobii]MTD59032.1 LysR family transcriptional regulator [Amycolatopsis pithecellobii]
MDANLLVALDALLRTGSVTRAAADLHTSPAAMSRTLGRLRQALGDPLLVRAGQGMVLTPRAIALRAEVAEVVGRTAALLTPGLAADPATLRTTFGLQASDLVVSALAPRLLELAAAEAPGVALRFASEETEGGPALRDGRVDLEIGVLDHVDPETETETLTTLAMALIVRAGHPLARGNLTARRFAEAGHVTVSRRGQLAGPADAALRELGLRRRVLATLPNHLSAMSLVARTDLVCLVPVLPHRAGAAGLLELAESFAVVALEIPFALPRIEIAMGWHPRNSHDGGHAWLRSAVRRAWGTGDGSRT